MLYVSFLYFQTLKEKSKTKDERQLGFVELLFCFVWVKACSIFSDTTSCREKKLANGGPWVHHRFWYPEKNLRWKFIFPLKHTKVFSMTGSVVDEHLIHLVCETSLWRMTSKCVRVTFKHCHDPLWKFRSWPSSTQLKERHHCEIQRVNQLAKLFNYYVYLHGTNIL